MILFDTAHKTFTQPPRLPQASIRADLCLVIFTDLTHQTADLVVLLRRSHLIPGSCQGAMQTLEASIEASVIEQVKLLVEPETI